MSSDRLDVVVETEAPSEEMREVEAAFERVGIQAEVRGGHLRLSADALPWVVELIAPLKWVALAFGAGAAGKAGGDAWSEYRAGGWRGLRRFMDEMVHARGDDPNGTITIRDSTGPDVQLWQGIPEEALRELADLDWSAMSNGRMAWNDKTGEWWFLHAQRAPRGRPAPRRSDSLAD